VGAAVTCEWWCVTRWRGGGAGPSPGGGDGVECGQNLLAQRPAASGGGGTLATSRWHRRWSGGAGARSGYLGPDLGSQGPIWAPSPGAVRGCLPGGPDDLASGSVC
jgi:hypothetical protein